MAQNLPAGRQAGKSCREQAGEGLNSKGKGFEI
jgi:hypothetical protein